MATTNRSVSGKAKITASSVLLVAAAWLFVADANSQAVDGATAATADIAVRAALDGLQNETRKQETIKRAAVLINNIRKKLDACGNEGMLALRNPEKDVAPKSGKPETATSRTAAVIPSRPPLQWNPLLDQAASRHARAMADQQFFDHVDPQGRTIGHRVNQTGYRWRVVGENIAAGQQSVDETVSGWLLSTAHCKILLDARFTEFGLAKVDAPPQDPFRSYWSLVLAEPQNANVARVRSNEPAR